MTPSLWNPFGLDEHRAKTLTIVAVIVIAFLGAFHAYLLRWLCDDIFITFRYIDQWFAGNGLVYNVGERVEGYTHPLWMLVLAGVKAVGLDMLSASVWLGLVSFVLLLLSLAAASRALSDSWIAAFPASAAVLSLHHDSAVWATSGLETSLFTLLVTASVLVFVLWNGEPWKGRLYAGVLAVLALLTRPDGVLLFALLGFVGVVKDWAEEADVPAQRKRLLAFVAPAVVLIPYALWKILYYGDILPNTFYAKSGGGSYFAQGWTYINSYLVAYPSTYGLLLLAVLSAKHQAKGVRAWIKACLSERTKALALVAGGFVLLYAAFFVARVGGDFMYARFLVPVVPLIYIAVESSLRHLLTRYRVTLLVALIALPVFAGTFDRWSRDDAFVRNEFGEVMLREESNGIVDEHYFWTKPITPDGQNSIVALSDVGKRLGKYFEGLDVRIVIRGQASLAYHARPSVVIENWGLTDSYIAHLPMSGRGRIGHEKWAPTEYLLARRVHFFFFKTYTPPDTATYRVIRFDLPHGWSLADMHYYDRGLMRALRERFPGEIHFVDFEGFLDEYLRNIDGRSRAQIEQDFAEFRAYYFYHNSDPERENLFVEALMKKR